MGRGIHRFQMIEDGDRVLVGTSGGKDSLSMSVALALRRRWVPIDYDLHAVLIEWREHPLPEKGREDLEALFEKLDVPLAIVGATLRPPDLAEPFNCYICARNRKRILFNEARDRGCAKVALGHHMDDVIETTLINLFFQGEFATMMPVQEFFGGKLKVIRPLVEVKETETARFARKHGLPVISSCCDRSADSCRTLMKNIVSRVYRINRKVRENIYRSPWRINWDYLPASLDARPARSCGRPPAGSEPARAAPQAASAAGTAQDVQKQGRL
jgi:tRNA 2-thiocytidine biosynthesis protein TtcA